jgi:hypothetical protein
MRGSGRRTGGQRSRCAGREAVRGRRHPLVPEVIGVDALGQVSWLAAREQSFHPRLGSPTFPPRGSGRERRRRGRAAYSCGYSSGWIGDLRLEIFGLAAKRDQSAIHNQKSEIVRFPFHPRTRARNLRRMGKSEASRYRAGAVRATPGRQMPTGYISEPRLSAIKHNRNKPLYFVEKPALLFLVGSLFEAARIHTNHPELCVFTTEPRRFTEA